MNTQVACTVIGAILSTCLTAQQQWFVATNGTDRDPAVVDNAGSITMPFATIQFAHDQASPGDTIEVRGGNYVLSDTVFLSKSGTVLQPMTLQAYQGESVILNAAAAGSVAVDGRAAIQVSHRTASGGLAATAPSHWHIKGLIVADAGRFPGNTSIDVHGFLVRGTCSNIVIENCGARHCTQSGFGLLNGPSNCLLLNCDSWANDDLKHRPGTIEDDADGFGIKSIEAMIQANPTTMAENGTNYLYGCRAWLNADDGYDFWSKDLPNNTVIVRYCDAWQNGYDQNGVSQEGNGNGFKLGKGGGDHVLYRCRAWRNFQVGFNDNENDGSIRVLNCTGWSNGDPTASITRNFRFLSKHNGVAWIDDQLWNNLSQPHAPGASPNAADKYQTMNTGSGVVPQLVTASDYASSNYTNLEVRFADGRLPRSDFLRPVGSTIIGAGQPLPEILYTLADVPDLGAVEAEDPISGGNMCGASLLVDPGFGVDATEPTDHTKWLDYVALTVTEDVIGGNPTIFALWNGTAAAMPTACGDLLSAPGLVMLGTLPGENVFRVNLAPGSGAVLTLQGSATDVITLTTKYSELIKLTQ